MVAKASSPAIIVLSILLFISVFYNISLSRKIDIDLTVTEVVDGDTFVLENDQRVRLRGLDGPETGRCGSKAAKDRLTELVEGKQIHLKNTIVDSYGRTLAHVYQGSVFVNEVMLEEGLARIQDEGTEAHEAFTAASKRAREAGLGIYSPTCRSTIPPDKSCVIKGNIRSGKKLFYRPTCEFYNQVVVDTSFGDIWFCTESEAKQEGFNLAETCSR